MDIFLERKHEKTNKLSRRQLKNKYLILDAFFFILVKLQLQYTVHSMYYLLLKYIFLVNSEIKIIIFCL